MTNHSMSDASGQTLFDSRRLTPPGEYTGKIEGPAVDAGGTLYVVNFKTDGTIGQVKPGTTKSEPFAKLPAGSIGNGIRFDREGRMYVADFKKHNVFVFEAGQTVPQVYFHSDKFNQPNDLAMAADGTLYASDPNFTKKTGQIWRIARGPDGKGHGEVLQSARPSMGTTNGIDLSPDGTKLYVSESVTREVWAYRIDDGKLTEPVMLRKFDKFELDGLRTDVDGNIFVTRPGAGSVAMLTAGGVPVRDIPTKGKSPSNLTFGGPDGRTVFVTQVDGRFIESFRVERPGREPCLQLGGAFC
ncbi:MAG: Gluconolactonase [Xanthobacteraceae bacterium]|jgi:signal peptidase|nr:Gluconolactonase [Xanthobacteraceae bacterium]